MPRLLTHDSWTRRSSLTARDAAAVRHAQPRLGLAGLNPHAGESGLLGQEDARAGAGRRGVASRGSTPAARCRPTRCSSARCAANSTACVACYHDQGLIPVKLLAFGQAVNVTIGLPIIRTSVDHGTAFDIAGKGVADPGSMVAAVRLAARLASAR